METYWLGVSSALLINEYKFPNIALSQIQVSALEWLINKLFPAEIGIINIDYRQLNTS